MGTFWYVAVITGPFAIGQVALAGLSDAWTRSNLFQISALTSNRFVSRDTSQYADANLNVTLNWERSLSVITDPAASGLPWIYNVQANSAGGLTPALQSEIHNVHTLNPAGAYGWLVWDEPSRTPMESAAVFAGEHVAGKLVMTSLATHDPIIMTHSSPSSRPRGFTLVELLVVIAIIGILIGMLLPAINAAREAARRAQCMNILKQMSVAVNMYHDVIGNYPQGRNTRDPMGVSWAFRLLPYIEQQSTHDAYDSDYRADADENALTMRTPVEVYFCPSLGCFGQPQALRSPPHSLDLYGGRPRDDQPRDDRPITGQRA